MQFRTQYDSHERVISHPGDPIHVIRKPQFDKDGNYDLVEAGVENTYDIIQSHAESVDIHVLMERYARGDVSALSATQGVYADVTGMPNTYAGLLNTMIDCEHQFDALPKETREKFGYSFERWMASLDDMPGWLDKMGYAPADPDLSLNNNTQPSLDSAKDGVVSE